MTSAEPTCLLAGFYRPLASLHFAERSRTIVWDNEGQKADDRAAGLVIK